MCAIWSKGAQYRRVCLFLGSSVKKKQGSRKFRDDYEGRGLPPVEHFGHVRTKPCIEYGYCLSLASIDGESPFPGYVTPRCCTSIG